MTVTTLALGQIATMFFLFAGLVAWFAVSLWLIMVCSVLYERLFFDGRVHTAAFVLAIITVLLLNGIALRVIAEVIQL